MRTVAEHLDYILEGTLPLAPVRASLAAAHGLILAEDINAELAVPPFENSAMDGFAVRAQDVATATADKPVSLPVCADVPAGLSGQQPTLQPGTTVRIMTGAPVPPGADAIVPVELTDQPAGPHAGKELSSHIAVHDSVATGQYIRRAGGDVVVGDAVLPAGLRLQARHLSAAASTGHGSLPVIPRPRVGVLATGAELLPPGANLGPGQIPDSNSILVAELVREAGAEPVVLRTVDDEPAALAALLDEHLDGLDFLITTGGVSAGAFDVIKELLDAEATAAVREHTGFTGGVTFAKVAMQPGKPQGFGVLTTRHGARVPVLTLPGNPVSVFVSFHVLAVPALAKLAGSTEPVGLTAARPAVAATGWRPAQGRTQFIPVVLEDPVSSGGNDGMVRVRPAAEGGSGSHLVASLARAQALAVVPTNIGQVGPGDVVQVMMVS